MSTKKLSSAAAVIDTYNNYTHIGIINSDGSFNLNLSFKDAGTLMLNKESSAPFEIRKNVPDKAEKGTPRPAIYGRYLGNDVLRVAVGKTNNPVKKAADLQPSIDYKIQNLEVLLQAAIVHMENLEEYKQFKIEFFKQFNPKGANFDLD